MIAAHFDPAGLEQFGLPRTWVSPSALRLEETWGMLGDPYLVCGHMHRTVLHSDGPRTAYLLAEHEVILLDHPRALTEPA